jgi:threonyl-tRNA synthetase
VYKPFGFAYKVGLSTRNPKKWMGDLKVWDDAEASLRAILEERVPGNWHVNLEDAAFYGPKVSWGNRAAQVDMASKLMI